MRGSHRPDRGHCPDALINLMLFMDSDTREDDTNLTTTTDGACAIPHDT